MSIPTAIKRIINPPGPVAGIGRGSVGVAVTTGVDVGVTVGVAVGVPVGV